MAGVFQATGGVKRHDFRSFVVDEFPIRAIVRDII